MAESMKDFKKEETKWEGTNQPTAPTAEPTSTVSSPNPTAPTATNISNDPDEILASLMKKIGDIGSDSYFKVLVFGDPGSTKSSFAATCPNNLILDTEDGLVAAKQSPNGIAEGVQQIPFESWDQMGALVGKIQEGKLEQFECFSVDTLSEMHKRALAEVTEREWRKRPSMNRYVAETEHHTENNERILRLFRALRDLKRDLIVTTHARTVEPKNRPAKTYPDFSESLANKICAFMDVVMYLEMRKVEGKIIPVGRVISNGSINAKNRIGAPEEILNPTYPMLKEMWEATRNK